MKTKELKNLQPLELEAKRAELENELIKLRGQAATGTALKNPGQIRQSKRTIAIINTLQKQRSKEATRKA
ncbi:50S ribosomal protein L29 [Candidatus Woesearchaeota archaeon]|nr:50S ribosomal protein L29 [Candidatus Woesearchaeota archaeon]